MSEAPSHDEETRLPRRSPVEVALASKTYRDARRAGIDKQASFIRSLLDKPSVKRSKAYRARIYEELIGAYVLADDFGRAADAGWKLLDNGMQYAHEAYYAAKSLFSIAGLAHPSLELVQRGREMANRRNSVFAREGLLFQLTFVELCIRTASGEANVDPNLGPLAARLDSICRHGSMDVDLALPMLEGLASAGVYSDFVVSIGKTLWGKVSMYQRFGERDYSREVAAIEAVIESVSNDKSRK